MDKFIDANSLEYIDPCGGVIICMAPHQPPRAPEGALLEDLVAEFAVQGLAFVQGQVQSSQQEAKNSTGTHATHEVEQLVDFLAGGGFQLAEDLDCHDASGDEGNLSVIDLVHI